MTERITLYQRTLIIPRLRLWYQGKAIKIKEKFMAFTIGCMKQLEYLANGDYESALEQNRENYQKVFQRYITSKKENKEYLLELLESIASSGRYLVDIKATMEKLNK